MEPRAGARVGNILGLVLVAVILGTLIGVLLVVSLRTRQAEGPGGTSPPPAATGGVDSSGNPVDGAPAAPSSNEPRKGADLFPRKGDTTRRGNNPATNNKGAKPFPGPRTPGVNPAAGRPGALTSGVTFAGNVGVSISGQSALLPGKPFRLEVTMDDLDAPIANYNMEARWNPKLITVESVEALKGGYAAPTNVNLTTPGLASWSASDAAAGAHQSLPVVAISGTVSPEAQGSVRFFINPKTVTIHPAGQTPRGQAGVPWAISLPVQ